MNLLLFNRTIACVLILVRLVGSVVLRRIVVVLLLLL